MSRRLGCRAALAFLALAPLLAGGCGETPPESVPEARAYDLEGRPLHALKAILGWNVAVLAFEDAPAAGAPSLGAGGAASEAVCTSPVVWPSAASLVTGLLPAAHGVEADGSVPPGIARAWTTAAEVLSAAYAFETAALRPGGWPPAALPMLQGFTTIAGRGEAPALLETWRAGRKGDGPFFVYLQLPGPATQAAPLLEALRQAGGSRPLLWAVTHLRGADVPLEAEFEQVYAERALLVPLTLGVPESTGAPPLPARGVSQRHLLAHLLERLGGEPLPGLQGERWAPGGEAAAVFEWTGGSPGAGGPRARVLRGARDERYTYAVAWDSVAGTVLEHLIDRQAEGGPAERVGADGKVPELDYSAALCAAIELVRNLTWAGVEDMNWRIRSGYVAGRQPVPGERPPPLCRGSGAAGTR